MSRLIVNKSRVLSSNTSAGTRKYIRNPEYLDLPTLVNGNEKIYMLVKVFEINNFITFYRQHRIHLQFHSVDFLFFYLRVSFQYS